MSSIFFPFRWFAILCCLCLVTDSSYGDSTKGSSQDSEKKEDFETLLKPFDPPSLAELDAKVEWEDRPVLDSLELLEKFQAKSQPLVTVAEALEMKNNSAEDNKKILSALGRFPESPDQVNMDATVIRHIGADVKSTNPLFISSSSEFDLLGLTSFGLFSFDWSMKPFAVKDTVVSWQSSKDGLYDKVVMRKDLTWSDGKPITAHDVVFSFKTIMDPRIPIPAVRSGTDEIRWVEAYDDHTLVYFHKEALSTNVWNINFPVIPKHIYEESLKEDTSMKDSDYHVQYETDPVVGGPYEIVKRVRAQEIVVQRREAWYMHEGKQVRKKPYFKRVVFRVITDPNTALLALKAGELEESVLNAEQWMSQTDGNDFYKRNTKVSAVEWVSFHFAWNIKSPYFSDVRVRKAMSYAFDHKEMLEQLFFGLHQPSTGVFHETHWASPAEPLEPYKQDLAKAEQLLDEAGWVDSDGDGRRDKEIDGRRVPFEFTIILARSPNGIKVCSLLRESLDRIGIKCTVRPMEFTVYQEKSLKHKFHALFGGWGAGADPDTLENIWGSDEDRNYVQYNNEKIDALFEKGRKEYDQEKRAKIYGEIQTILYEDQPYTWLFYRNAFYGFNKKLRGYHFSPRGPYSYGPGFSSFWQAKQAVQ